MRERWHARLGLWLDAAARPRLEHVRCVYPRVSIELQTAAPATCDVERAVWDDEAFDFWAFDRALDRVVEEGRPLWLSSDPEPAARFVLQVLTRAQRCICSRNEASAWPWFDGVLAAHARLHDLSRPLVRADYDHALDCWQWILRLDGAAGAAPQLAGLLHDVERLSAEPDRRIEQHAADYAAFKRAHAARGAELAAALLERCGVDRELTSRVAALIEHSEEPDGDRESQLLNDADALSFFSLNSAGFWDYFPREHTRTKVSYTVRRMSARARAELSGVRLRSGIRALLEEVARAHA